ncbi:MAG TPA: methenyltetrahydromethanopterin cyclohydrolase, partial [Methanocorpusculum sp.]|nr:methenyltetrahydromethanopterin cyclohydrolase [Methanocorpusculum sp.]
MVSVNELGLDLFEELVENADLFNVAYHELDNGARIVDCGVAVPGGFGAGDYFTRICMGGLGDIAFRQGMVGKFPMTFIDVNTDFPAISCLGAQKAGWTVKHENFFAMGSGPARALSLQP